MTLTCDGIRRDHDFANAFPHCPPSGDGDGGIPFSINAERMTGDANLERQEDVTTSVLHVRQCRTK